MKLPPRWIIGLKIIGLALLYAGLAKLVLAFFSDRGNVTLIWFPAGLGLAAFLLNAKEHHQHHHSDANHGHLHGHHEHHHHHDLNLRAAYLHVVADATTSILAIGALLAGKYLEATWMDPTMGIVGSILVGTWARGLMRDSSRVLLDAEMDSAFVKDVMKDLQTRIPTAELTDFDLWRVGKLQYACIVGVDSVSNVSLNEVRNVLQVHKAIAHSTIEINTTIPS